jgi:hypothetical protein
MADLHTPTGGNDRGRKDLVPDRFYLLNLYLNLKPLKDQLVIGVADISTLLYGKDDRESVRATYHLLESSNTLPAVKFGARWSIRPSAIRAKWWSEESKSFPEESQALLVKAHILLSAIVPLLADVCNGALDDEKALHLAHGVDEVTRVIERLLRVRSP